MGRGGRHWSDTHPDRDLWTPAEEQLARGMEQAAYEALYGRGPAVTRQSEVSSPLFRRPPINLLLEIRDRDLSTRERMEIWKTLGPWQGESLVSDALVEELFQNEFRQLDLPIEEGALRKVWEEELGRIPQTGLSDPYLLARRPLSLRALSFRAGLVPPGEALEWWYQKEDEGNFAQFFREEILPEAGFWWNPWPLRASNPMPLWEESMTRWLRESFDNIPDPEGGHRELLRILHRGGYQKIDIWERFPLHSSLHTREVEGSFPSREFLNEMVMQLPLSVPEEDAAENAARSVLARQVLRILHDPLPGVYSWDEVEADQTRHRERWEDFLRDQGPNPLLSLEPIFRGLDLQDGFQEIIDGMNRDRRWRVGAGGLAGRLEDRIMSELPLSPGKQWGQELLGIIRSCL